MDYKTLPLQAVVYLALLLQICALVLPPYEEKVSEKNLWHPPEDSHVNTREEWLRTHGLGDEQFKELKQKIDLIAAKQTNAGMLPKNANFTHATHKDEALDGCIKLSEEQADLILKEAEYESSNHTKKGRTKRKLYDFRSNPARKWTMPIRIMFDGQHSDYEKHIIRAAFKHWEEGTCIRFEEVPTNAPVQGQYVLITRQPEGCFTFVGKTSVIPQQFNLEYNCLWEFGIPVHEIGHILGLWHEHQREDRDAFIKINWDNLGYYESQFYKINTLRLGQTYDYSSVMHYSSKEGSKNGKVTIEATDRRFQSNMGQRIAASFIDKKMINLEYCKNRCYGPEPPCQRDGYQDPNNCYSCICPDGFAGDHCQYVDSYKGPEPCGGRVNLNNFREIVINSPGYERGYYHEGQACNWLLKAPPGYRPLMRFEGDFGVYCHLHEQCYHWVEVRTDENLGANGGRFCCYSTPKDIFRAETDEMLITFRSNYSSRWTPASRGFKMIIFTERVYNPADRRPVRNPVEAPGPGDRYNPAPPSYPVPPPAPPPSGQSHFGRPNYPGTNSVATPKPSNPNPPPYYPNPGVYPGDGREGQNNQNTPGPPGSNTPAPYNPDPPGIRVPPPTPAPVVPQVKYRPDPTPAPYRPESFTNAPYRPETPAPYRPPTAAPYVPETPTPYRPETPSPYQQRTPAPYRPETPAPYRPDTPAPPAPYVPEATFRRETLSPYRPETARPPAPYQPETPAPYKPETARPRSPDTYRLETIAPNRPDAAASYTPIPIRPATPAPYQPETPAPYIADPPGTYRPTPQPYRPPETPAPYIADPPGTFKPITWPTPQPFRPPETPAPYRPPYRPDTERPTYRETPSPPSPDAPRPDPPSSFYPENPFMPDDATEYEPDENEQDTPSPPRDTPLPTRYTDPPKRDTPLPQRYTPPPLRDTPLPQSYTPSPKRDTPLPRRYTPSPPRDTPLPTRNTPSPKRDTPLPQRYTPSPPRDTPLPHRYTPSPPRDTPLPRRDTPLPSVSPYNPFPTHQDSRHENTPVPNSNTSEPQNLKTPPYYIATTPSTPENSYSNPTPAPYIPPSPTPAPYIPPSPTPAPYIPPDPTPAPSEPTPPPSIPQTRTHNTASSAQSSVSQYLTPTEQKNTVPPVTSAAPDCTMADFALVLDASGSMGAKDYRKVKIFGNDLIDDLDIGTETARMGVMTFANRAIIEAHLLKYLRKIDLKYAVNVSSARREWTNTTGALMVLRKELFNTKYGDRSARANIAILVLGGPSNLWQTRTIAEAENARNEGIDLYVIGVSDKVDRKELDAITGDKNKVLQVPDYDELLAPIVLQQVMDMVCSGGQIPATYEWECSFETDDPDNQWCGIEQVDFDEFDWKLWSRPTPSAGTGPFEAYHGSYYIYIEATDQKENDQAIFLLPKPNRKGEYCLNFYYHMDGHHVGTLQVFVERPGNERSYPFTVRGHHGEDWLNKKINITLGQVDQVGFRAVRGSGYLSDIGLDKLSLNSGNC